MIIYISIMITFLFLLLLDYMYYWFTFFSSSKIVFVFFHPFLPLTAQSLRMFVFHFISLSSILYKYSSSLCHFSMSETLISSSSLLWDCSYY